jgi:hypothetical protein
MSSLNRNCSDRQLLVYLKTFRFLIGAGRSESKALADIVRSFCLTETDREKLMELI